MILGRLILALNASSNSIIRPSWLTKIFVIGDVISFLMQCGGMVPFRCHDLVTLETVTDLVFDRRRIPRQREEPR